MKDNFVTRLQAEKHDFAANVERMTGQFYVDTLQIALARYGKLKLGFQRIMEITNLWEQVRKEYDPAITKHVESDVARSHLDAELLQIAKDKKRIIPFHQRYPEVRQVDYRGRKERHP